MASSRDSDDCVVRYGGFAGSRTVPPCWHLPASAMPTTPASASESNECTSCCLPAKGKVTCRAESRSRRHQAACRPAQRMSGQGITINFELGCCPPPSPGRALKRLPSWLMRPAIASSDAPALQLSEVGTKVTIVLSMRGQRMPERTASEERQAVAGHRRLLSHETVLCRMPCARLVAHNPRHELPRGRSRELLEPV